MLDGQRLMLRLLCTLLCVFSLTDRDQIDGESCYIYKTEEKHLDKLLTRFTWSLSWTKIGRTENIEGTETCCVLQVEEVRRHSHCLAFSSAGPQSQTYYVSYDSYTEHLRWQRTASKVRRRISACASLPVFLHFY